MSATGSLRLPRTEQSARVRRLPGDEGPAPVASTPPLSVLLEEATARTRQQAEQSLFLQSVFSEAWEGGVYGQFVRAWQYAGYLRQLHVLYAAFESVLPEVVESSLTAVLLLPELRRASALEEDLAYFCGETRTGAQACLETRLHAERLREVAHEAPHLLVAHAYARCMLDLVPAPLRARRIAEAFELEGGGGTRFYEGLATGPDMESFRARFLSRLDGLRLDEDEVRELLQEARMAFRLHALVCEELARGAPGIAALRALPGSR